MFQVERVLFSSAANLADIASISGTRCKRSRPAGSRAAAQSAGLKYIHLPFDAAAPDPKVVESFLAAVADKTNQPAFIHCGSANRVGAVWMIKRALQEGWPIEKARA